MGEEGGGKTGQDGKKIIIEIILKTTFVFILINFEDIYVSDK